MTIILSKQYKEGCDLFNICDANMHVHVFEKKNPYT